MWVTWTLPIFWLAFSIMIVDNCDSFEDITFSKGKGSFSKPSQDLDLNLTYPYFRSQVEFWIFRADIFHVKTFLWNAQNTFFIESHEHNTDSKTMRFSNLIYLIFFSLWVFLFDVLSLPKLGKCAITFHDDLTLITINLAQQWISLCDRFSKYTRNFKWTLQHLSVDVPRLRLNFARSRKTNQVNF